MTHATAELVKAMTCITVPASCNVAMFCRRSRLSRRWLRNETQRQVCSAAAAVMAAGRVQQQMPGGPTPVPEILTASAEATAVTRRSSLQADACQSYCVGT